MSTSYLEKLNRLKKDEYQKAAFESQNNTVVLAGPGSGFNIKGNVFVKQCSF